MSKYKATIKLDGTGVFVNSAGDQIERVCLDVAGQDVQVVYHDGDTRGAIVFIGGKAEYVHETEIAQFIESQLKAGKP